VDRGLDAGIAANDEIETGLRAGRRTDHDRAVRVSRPAPASPALPANLAIAVERRAAANSGGAEGANSHGGDVEIHRAHGLTGQGLQSGRNQRLDAGKAPKSYGGKVDFT
jgi:hypothetical protein